ncbi:hypothetical protein HG535_0F02530 [Zygotorulaspora mrakii]|uniref:Altered inheritance of mitochondria protein 21 n=1 Tax=Zygotorulaspora mrakii TaxID=42260 RepID=A0A7H9B7N4_ZYGMR|nr:uncharacterized protein HG535_0F02530 [Zygotorulaspora mrakii]QLG73742.1 hypothetical protein HG535_0F02530 [Zygotorulaspora mrakii]
MSTEQVPKIPNRPVRRRKTSEEIVPGSVETPSVVGTENSRVADETDSSIPGVPLHRPLKSQTAPDFPLIQSGQPPHEFKTEEGTGEEKTSSAPPTSAENTEKVDTTEGLDDIAEGTSEQLRELQNLISRHGIIKRERPAGSNQAPEASADREYSEDPITGISKDSTASDLGLSGNLLSKASEGPVDKLSTPFAESRDDLSEYGIEAETASDTKPTRGQSAEVHVDAYPGILEEQEKEVQTEPAIPARPKKINKGMEKGKSGFVPEMRAPSTNLIPTEETSSQQAQECGKNQPPIAEQKTGQSNPDNENQGEVPITKLNTDSTDSLSETVTVKKRAAPPVPKKPSSRIAAFQEMLQKQQQEEIQQHSIPAKTNTSTQPEEPEITLKRPSQQVHSLASNDKAKFAQNLNGIFALPGMTPQGNLPASLSQKLKQTSVKEEGLTSKDKSLSDIRHNRSKGPRGRKLPTNISKIEKISTQDSNNEIEVFNTWSIVYTKERKTRMKPQDITSSRREIPHHLADNLQGLISAGIQERRPSLSETQINELPLLRSEGGPMTNNAASFAVDESPKSSHIDDYVSPDQHTKLSEELSLNQDDSTQEEPVKPVMISDEKETEASEETTD